MSLHVDPNTAIISNHPPQHLEDESLVRNHTIDTIPNPPRHFHEKDINLLTYFHNKYIRSSKKFDVFIYNRIARYFGGIYQDHEDYDTTNNNRVYAHENEGHTLLLVENDVFENRNNNDVSLSSSYSSSNDDTAVLYVNQNVIVMLVLTMGFGAVKSIWENTITGAYYTQTSVTVDLDPNYDDASIIEDNDDGTFNEIVPYIVGSDGLLGMIIAIPIGKYLDRYRKRGPMIKFGAQLIIYGSVTLIITILVLRISDEEIGKNNKIADEDTADAVFWVYLGVELIWIILREIMQAPAFVLFVASIPADERRTDGLILFYSAMTLFSFVGPLISAILYSREGDSWSNETMKSLLLSIIMGTLFISFGLFYFDDDKAIYNDIVPSTIFSDTNDIIKREDCLTETLLQDHLEKNLPNEKNELLKDKSVENTDDYIKGLHKVAISLMIGVLLSSIGLGIIADFTERFINENTSLTYSETELIFILLPFVYISSYFFSGYLSKRYGRPKIIVLCKSIGALLLFSVAFSLYLGNDTFFLLTINFMVVIIQMTIPLEVSLLVDVVDGDRLALFLSIFGVLQYSWNVSSFLGAEIDGHVSDALHFLLSALICSFSVISYYSILSLKSF